MTNSDYTRQLIARGWIKPSGEPVYPRQPRPGLLEFCEWPLLTLRNGEELDVTWTINV